MADLTLGYLKQPYGRLLIPENDGSFRGEILEFPGCIATGDTPGETLSALESAAKDWLIAALERGQSIPEPIDGSEFSGRLVLRLPKSLHKKASRLAHRNGVSLNQFIVAGVAECVGEQAKPTISGTITFVMTTTTAAGNASFERMVQTGSVAGTPSQLIRAFSLA